jgi:hypothetical protein
MKINYYSKYKILHVILKLRMHIYISDCKIENYKILKMTYEILRINPNYEINTQYPHDIRKIIFHTPIMKFFDRSSNYYRIHLSKRLWLFHVISAIQWIPNPNKLPIVDHEDGDTKNFHLENLHWVTASENMKNKHTYKGIPYEFIEELPINSIEVKQYKNHTISNLFYNKESRRFYLKITNNKYKILPIKQQNFRYFIIVYDINNIPFNLSIKKIENDETRNPDNNSQRNS